ncbi:mandelate racemase/muconate lactonizing enzyme family protein [Tropicimonas sp. IMCC34011]|uniref:mandelate racemase/muconate lactonizing enzyme family protein n=1 Tax=Tropicimonas sp. IMCC34011 TaxID=2248759 RepID=UPI000E255919|nr:enolase C-terminal domain-like protein [Tropicimonas sp. IMCC34011]
MKISEIEVFPINIPTLMPYVLSHGTVGSAQSVIIKLHADNGVFGIGDTSPSPTFSEESQQSVVSSLTDFLEPAIKGMDPFDIEAIHLRMDEVLKGNSFAKAAIGIALYDLLGKHLGLPVHALIGGLCRGEFPLLWPLMGGDADTNAKEAESAVKRGHRSVMIKVGHNDPQVEIERVAAVRKVVGDGFVIIPDANQGWTPQVALQCIRGMAKYGVAWVEQPVPRWDLDGLARVRGAVDVPISADESICSMYDAMSLIKRDAVDIVSLKLQKSEGFSRAKKIAAITQAANVPIFMNSMVETGGNVAASLQFAASTPNVIPYSAALMSTLRLQDDILMEGGLEIENATIKVSKRPGLGVELDERKLSEYAVSMPQLRAAGS